MGGLGTWGFLVLQKGGRPGALKQRVTDVQRSVAVPWGDESFRGDDCGHLRK